MIWVIDDNEDVALSTAKVLELEDLPAVPVLRVEDALKKLKQGEKPEVIVLDLHMPGLSGNALLQEMQKHPSLQVPVIVTTGFPDELTTGGMQPVQVMVKPVRVEGLLAVLRRVLGVAT